MTERTKVDITELFKSAGINIEDMLDRDRTGDAPYFFEYHFESGETIEVEATAIQAMHAICMLSVEKQKRLFWDIASRIKHPGEQLILNDNREVEDGEGNKKLRSFRSAQAIRLASDDEKVTRLSLTF